MIKFFSRGLMAMGFALAAGAACAQAFPSRPITLIVPFAPGASADGISRIVAKEMSDALGQLVIVDNKPGGGGALGLISVAKSNPDGYTIGLGATGAIAVNPHLPDAAPLKPQKDLTPISKLADIPLVLVSGSNSGMNSFKEFEAKAKATPNGVSYGTTGQYTSHHLAGELLAASKGLPMVAVPYKGSSPAVTDVLGGTLDLAMVDMTAAYPHIKSGKLIALGVTSATRTKVAPEIPTIAEGGVPGYAAPAWMGLFAPAQTPQAVIDRLDATIRTVLAKPSVQAQILSLSAEPSYLNAHGFNTFIAGESAKWADIIAKIPAPKN